MDAFGHPKGNFPLQSGVLSPQMMVKIFLCKHFIYETKLNKQNSFFLSFFNFLFWVIF